MWLGKLVCLRVLFLQEQVRDLRVQEFLRELVVGVAAPSDLEGSIIVKSFIVVRRGCRASVLEPQNNSPIFVIAHLFLTCLDILHVLIMLIFICLI